MFLMMNNAALQFNQEMSFPAVATLDVSGVLESSIPLFMLPVLESASPIRLDEAQHCRN
jgi:hypothetical protein